MSLLKNYSNTAITTTRSLNEIPLALYSDQSYVRNFQKPCRQNIAEMNLDVEIGANGTSGMLCLRVTI